MFTLKPRRFRYRNRPNYRSSFIARLLCWLALVTASRRGISALLMIAVTISALVAHDQQSSAGGNGLAGAGEATAGQSL